MEYLRPIETLQDSIRRYQKIVYALCAVLGMSIVFVPALFTSGPYVIVDDDSVHRMLKSKPWEVSVSRIESFTKQYLSNRFEWTQENFQQKEGLLKSYTDETVFKKLKDSLSSFKILAQNQKAKCFYVFEGYGFSNSDKKIEAHITRVLRMGAIAASTPLVVRLLYRETGISEVNPYGLQITGIEEVEVSDMATKGGHE